MGRRFRHLKTIRKPNGRVYNYLRHPTTKRLIPLPANLPIDSETFAQAYDIAFEFEVTDRRQIEFVLSKCLKAALSRSKSLGRPCDLDIDFLKQMMAKQNYLCAISGIPFEAKPSRKRINPYRPSIDRIDSSVGYLRTNVRIVLAAVNLGMSDFGEQVYREICDAVASNANRTLPEHGKPVWKLPETDDPTT